MVVSTIYDKDLKAKVFQVRDSERYTNSTLTSLEATYNNAFKNYLSVTLTATVQKNLGESSIAFYDGEEYLGVVSCVQGTSPSPFTTKVPYGHHSFWAKYLGNAQCLSSKSGIVELEVDDPDLINSHFWTIYDEHTTTYFIYDEYGRISIDGYLLDESDNHMDGATVKIYYDDTLLAAVETTDGYFQHHPSGDSIPVGDYMMTLIYEGDDTHFGCDLTFPIKVLSSNYIVSATPKHSKVLVGSEIEVDVLCTTYDGTPVANQELTIEEVGELSWLDRATTNNEGTAILSTPANVAKTYSLQVSRTMDDFSDPITIEAVNGDMSLSATEMVVCEGITSKITAFVNFGGNPIEGISVELGGNTYITGANGNVSYNVAGTGSGSKTITATCGSITRSITIEDVLMYFNNAANKNFGLNYLTGNSLAATIMSAGFQLASPNTREGMLYFYLENTPSDWSLEFKVMSSVKSVSPSTDFKVNGVTVSDSILNAKPTIRFTKQNNLVTVYSNDNTIGSVTSYDMFPTLKLGMGQTLVIDNIKYMRL